VYTEAIQSSSDGRKPPQLTSEMHHTALTSRSAPDRRKQGPRRVNERVQAAAPGAARRNRMNDHPGSEAHEYKLCALDNHERVQQRRRVAAFAHLQRSACGKASGGQRDCLSANARALSGAVVNTFSGHFNLGALCKLRLCVSDARANRPSG
jgi:hypothetical protein